MIASPGFDQGRLENMLGFPEREFLDFKLQPPILGRPSDDEKFIFAKCLIALGNWARTSGHPCYIIFGVDDKDRQKRKDLRDFYHPTDIDHWGPEVSIQTKQSDGVEQRIRELANNWVQPSVSPSFRLEYGHIADSTFLSYLEITPSYSSEPFSLRKDGKDPKGTVYVRWCTSSVSITPTEVQYLLPANKIAYLSTSEWQSFYDYHSSGDFEIEWNLLPYFPPVTTDGKDALATIKELISANEKLILVRAVAGDGKTTFLRRLAYGLSHQVNVKNEIQGTGTREFQDYGQDDYEVKNFRDELSNVPKSKIPIFLSLKTLINTPADLNGMLSMQIAKNIVGNPKMEGRDIKDFLSIPFTSWIILLDGIDEIRGADSGVALMQWMDLLPNNVQVLITSRPYASDGFAGKVIELAPLKKKEIRQLIEQKMDRRLSRSDTATQSRLKELGEGLLKFIDEHEELYTFINRHRAIDGLLGSVDGPAGGESVLSDNPQTLVEKRIVAMAEDRSGSIPVLDTVAHETSGLEEIQDQVEGPSEMVDDTQQDKAQGDEGPQQENISSANDNWPDPANESENDQNDEKREEVKLWVAQVVAAVYAHLQKMEITRQRELNRESQKEAETAEFDLSVAAWEGNWSKSILNTVSTRISEESIEWNQFAGFIHYLKTPRYRYCCSLFQQFLIALYGYENIELEEWQQTVQNKSKAMKQPIHNVIELYNDLCEWRGEKESL